MPPRIKRTTARKVINLSLPENKCFTELVVESSMVLLILNAVIPYKPNISGTYQYNTELTNSVSDMLLKLIK